MNKNVETLLIQVLSETPETRDNDKLLELYVWEKQGLHLTDSQKQIFLKCVSSESITRGRRKLNERGLFLPSEAIQKQRSFMEETYRTEMKKQPLPSVDYSNIKFTEDGRAIL